MKSANQLTPYARRIIPLLLAAFIAAGAAACKNSGGGASSKARSQAGGASAAESGDASLTDSGVSDSGGPASGGASAESRGSSGGGDTVKPSGGLEGNTYVSGFPIVKNKETLSIMAITRPDVGDVAKSQFTREYARMTNINIQWTLVRENQAMERKRLAIESGNMPDIFAIGGSYVTQSDMLDYSETGAIREITKETLRKFGPNICKMYDAYPETWKLTADPQSGKMYQLAGFLKDYPYGQHYLWVRKTWLDELEIPMPKTMNEFYDMLAAFKNDDPNGNGQKDEIPYATWHNAGFSAVPWGVNRDVVVDNSGKVNLGFATENMKNCLSFWNRVYKEGLVDKNTIDNWDGENAAFKTLLSTGKAGVVFWGYPGNHMTDALFKEYEPMPWPTAGNNGNYPSVAMDIVDVPQMRSFLITKNCKNPTAAIRFLDYLYTDDGFMLAHYGTEYKKLSDKAYELKLTGKEITGPKWTLTGKSFLSDSVIQEKETLQQKKNKDALNIFKNQLASVGTYNRLPIAQQSKQEIQQIKRYDTYFKALSGKAMSFVEGTATLTGDWTALQNEMTSKGLKEYLKALQAYYDRLK